MSVRDWFEPSKDGRLKAGLLAAALIPSGPGTAIHHDWDASSLRDIQASGGNNALKYWDSFSPILDSSDRTILPVLDGSGSDIAFSTVLRVTEPEAGGHMAMLPISHGETIACIRAALSVQVKELAEILHVQRPTIYSWMKGEAEPSAVNRVRMQQVYRLATEWNRRCNLPAENLIRASASDGHSVLGLLQADDIDEAGILRRFEGLAVERLRIKAEVDRSRPEAANIARSNGHIKTQISDQQHVTDAATGKRATLD